MLKLPLELRNQIVNYLKALQVQAVVGADIMQITKALDGLEKIEDTIPTNVPPEATESSQDKVNS